MRRVTAIDYERFLDVLSIDGERLASCVGSAPGDSPVPGCPGLTLAETARRLGDVYRSTADWTRSPGGTPVPAREVHLPRQGDDRPLAEYLRTGLAEVAGELSAHRPEERCPTWWPADGSFGFWARRLTHETIVHRVDVQAAAGVRCDHVDTDIAVDGVDEVLTLWFDHRLGELAITASRQATVAVRTGGRVWLTHAGATGTTVRALPPDATPKVDATVSGDPFHVYLWLWGRLPDWAVTMDGDADALAQLWVLLNVATR
ncbi:hypothetical protein FHR81_004850 [Actinoalloteichus hoggarensis]|uniref:Uncharacterized protein n=1 Tax=Actinoalloteichus hoggarensis TaxID=1470176 RepID=A0A221W8Z7_9PSEU|nr:maleylpyruvate isomerase N-terminal domain-containing protein [Actinoalloteichus hoggarensis]ASO22141.1 hypothetical protein AHOG_22640 [Actinoalloteichus hoggarensis]MBB5923777.1 hypothetical protein [Actinoalloteichus hoggarensis]